MFAAFAAQQLPGKPQANRGRILVVEDEPEMCGIVARYLNWLGYEVSTALGLEEALAELSKMALDLVVTDLRLGTASGLELMSEIRERTPRTRIILMSAHADAESAAAAIEQGVDHLLLKPFEPAELQARVEQSLARRWAEEQVERERRALQDSIRRYEEQTQTWIRRAAHSLTSAVEAKDRYTAGHAQRVTAYAMALAEEIGGIDPERFRLACDLHDVGKIGVPDSVLNRPARLSEEEYRMVAAHPDTGARILRPLVEDELVLGAVRSHHERWDGRGYPDGLAGEQIPLAARILAVADTLDAITSNRAYREARPWSPAVEEIRACAGSQFDPRVIAAFDAICDRLEQLYVAFFSAGTGREG
jgi:putative two-component system response regulator